MPDPSSYPRPDFRRDPWTDLCGEWRFAHDDADVGLREDWARNAEPFTRTITVPFPPESKASGVHETGYHPVVWYRRTFEVAEEKRPARLLLHFGAVDWRAQVWVNGRLAVEHEGGHTPFSVDIAPLLVDGAEQVLVVRAEDQPEDLTQPRGKQYWRQEPGRIWYHRTTGIWQPVWLERTGELAITELRWTPDLDQLGIGLQLRLNKRPGAPVRVRVRLSCEGQPLVDDIYAVSSAELRREIRLDPDTLMRRRYALTWAPHHPNLIDAIVDILDEDGRRLDRVESYFGLRQVEVQDGRFLLNGVPTFMRLVLAQNYWPETLLASTNEAMRREVELVKSMGFNGLQIHQKIEDPRFLYWCDKLGLMVWGEAANAYVFDERATARLTREWLEALARDYNHPSIVCWVPLNESWGVPNLDRDPAQRDFVRALYHLTKAQDPTRPCIGNDGWQHAVGDVFGVHDYSPSGETLRQRYGSPEAITRSFAELRPHHVRLLTEGGRLDDQPVVLSEFGGLSLKPPEGAKWFGYSTGASAEEVLGRYEELVSALLASTALAGFCYTQLTDTEQETNGLLAANRTPKLDPERIRAINTQPSRAVPSEVLDAIQLADILKRRAEAKGGGGEIDSYLPVGARRALTLLAGAPTSPPLTRRLAPVPPKEGSAFMASPLMPGCTGVLALADGTVLQGIGVGATGSAVGEVCFNTAMTGYQEILTDPSYMAQIVTFTFPHIGNVGVNLEDVEQFGSEGGFGGARTTARGAIFRDLPTEPANWRAHATLDSWMKRRGVVGLAGVDTRALTRRIREQGMPHAVIAHDPEGRFDLDALIEQARGWSGLVGLDLAKDASTLQSFTFDEGLWSWPEGYAKPRPEPRFEVAVLDYGIKRNILRALTSVGARATVVPASSTAEEVLARKPDGVLLSNGPGDPAATGEYAVPEIRKLVESGTPVFGICLGHQMLARALGAETSKMDQGHHGANHPVKDLTTGKVEIVSMNHGFTVDRATLPEPVQETHVSLFDGTNAGLALKDRPVFSVQHHPEASPGPTDSLYLFERFAGLMESARRS